MAFREADRVLVQDGAHADYHALVLGSPFTDHPDAKILVLPEVPVDGDRGERWARQGDLVVVRSGRNDGPEAPDA